MQLGSEKKSNLVKKDSKQSSRKIPYIVGVTTLSVVSWAFASAAMPTITARVKMVAYY